LRHSRRLAVFRGEGTFWNDFRYLAPVLRPLLALLAALAPSPGRPDLGWLGCLPRYHNEQSSRDGNVTAFRVSTSSDGASFSERSAGIWAADGQMKVATFGPAPARYLRFEILAAKGRPAVTEITVGARR
jgi:hypothetical protein